MIVIFNTKTNEFTGYKDNISVSNATGITINTLHSLGYNQIIKINDIVIGKLKIIKSNRGGKR